MAKIWTASYNSITGAVKLQDGTSLFTDVNLKELSLTYQRLRQAAITQEITEVVSGAKAQKKKKMQKSERGLVRS